MNELNELNECEDCLIADEQIEKLNAEIMQAWAQVRRCELEIIELTLKLSQAIPIPIPQQPEAGGQNEE